MQNGIETYEEKRKATYSKAGFLKEVAVSFYNILGVNTKACYHIYANIK